MIDIPLDKNDAMIIYKALKAGRSWTPKQLERAKELSELFYKASQKLEQEKERQYEFSELDLYSKTR